MAADGLRAGLIVLQNDIAAGVHHLGVEVGLDKHAVPGESGIGARHLHGGDAESQTAQSQRRVVNIRFDLSGTGHIIGGQAGDAEPLLHIIIGLLKPQQIQRFDCTGVQGLDHRGINTGQTAVCSAGVLRPRITIAVDLERGVIHCGIGGDQSLLDRRSVYRDRLDRRSWGPQALSRTHQSAVDGLFAQAAGQRHNAAGLVVHHRNGGLELLAGLRGRTAQRVRIAVDLIHLGLRICIKAGINGQAAAEDHIVCRILIDAQLFHQVIPHAVDDGIHIPGIDLCGRSGIVLLAAQREADGGRVRIVSEVLVAVVIGRPVGLIAQLGQRRKLLLLADLILLIHLDDHGGRALHVVVPVVDRIVNGGVVGDADQAGTFGQIQLTRFLVEVLVRSSIDAVALAAKVDIVEVHLQDLFLGVGLFKLQRREDLQHLAFDGDVVVIRNILDELLGQRGAALHITTGKHIDHRTCGALPVHAVVLPEALVLDRHRGVDQILRDLVIGHPDTVLPGIERLEFRSIP